MFKVEAENMRNYRISLATGILFFTGWWIAIDVWAVHGRYLKNEKVYLTPGIVNTASFIVTRKIPIERLNRSFEHEGGVTGFRTLLFLSLIAGFCSLIAAIYILVEIVYYSIVPHYIGVGIFVQNLFILTSTLVWKFCRTYDDVVI